MTYYMQRECNYENVVPSGHIVKFDTPVVPKAGDPPSADIIYQTEGTFDILHPGTYSIFWYTVGMVSHSTVGDTYQLKKLDYGQSDPAWVTVAGTSNHIRVSQTPGFAIVVVAESEIEEHGKATIALFNMADATGELTMHTPKAGILIFGFDLESVENDMTAIADQITGVIGQLQIIEEFVHLSDVTEMWSLTPKLAGIGVAVITSGYTHNFWGIGTLNQQQTLNAGETIYLITVSQYPPLGFYQGDSTIGTLWIETPGPTTNIFSFPVRFDAAGIYFTPNATYQNLPPGTSFKFTQALILVKPSTP